MACEDNAHLAVHQALNSCRPTSASQKPISRRHLSIYPCCHSDEIRVTSVLLSLLLPKSLRLNQQLPVQNAQSAKAGIACARLCELLVQMQSALVHLSLVCCKHHLQMHHLLMNLQTQLAHTTIGNLASFSLAVSCLRVRCECMESRRSRAESEWC